MRTYKPNPGTNQGRRIAAPFDFKRLAERIPDQGTLERALFSLSGHRRAAVIEGLRPYLKFEPV